MNAANPSDTSSARQPEKPEIPASRTFWQRRLRDPIVAQLTQGITPEKLAVTFAVGSALALFPILGTTTLLCLAAGILLRLNQPIIQIVNFLCTPIHIPLVFFLVNLGERFFGVPHQAFSIRYMRSLLRNDPAMFLDRFGTTALQAIIAWLVLAPLWITIIYFVTRPLLRGISRVKAENAAQTVGTRPPNHPVP